MAPGLTCGATYGVYGKNTGSNTRGYLGYTNYGVYGLCPTTDACAVYAYAHSATGSTCGVRGYSASTPGIGVYGRNGSATGTTYGVYREVASGDGYAGYFDGGRGVRVSSLWTFASEALELKVNSARAFRIEPDATSPNLTGGYSGNTVTASVHGAVIAGGGEYGYVNRVTDHHGVVGGGRQNQAGDGAGTVGDAPYATVGGGYLDVAAARVATVPDGRENAAAGDYSFAAQSQPAPRSSSLLRGVRCTCAVPALPRARVDSSLRRG